MHCSRIHYVVCEICKFIHAFCAVQSCNCLPERWCRRTILCMTLKNVHICTQIVGICMCKPLPLLVHSVISVTRKMVEGNNFTHAFWYRVWWYFCICYLVTCSFLKGIFARLFIVFTNPTYDLHLFADILLPLNDKEYSQEFWYFFLSILNVCFYFKEHKKMNGCGDFWGGLKSDENPWSFEVFKVLVTLAFWFINKLYSKTWNNLLSHYEDWYYQCSYWMSK